MSNSSNEEATDTIQQQEMTDRRPYRGALMAQHHKTLELMSSRWFGELSFMAREARIRKNWDGYRVQPKR